MTARTRADRSPTAPWSAAPSSVHGMARSSMCTLDAWSPDLPRAKSRCMRPRSAPARSTLSLGIERCPRRPNASHPASSCFSSIPLMAANPINNEGTFAQAALEHWRLLGQELSSDVEQFNQKGGSASFSRTSDHEYRVSNSNSGLEVRIVADPQDHIARYDFIRTS